MKTDKIVSLILVMLMTISSITFLVPSSEVAALRSQSSTVTLTNYTYEALTGTFTSPDTPQSPQASVPAFDTDWGSIGLGTTFSTIVPLYYGLVAVPSWLSMYDTMLDYWYYNGTLGGSGRPFVTHWTSWYTLRDDSNVASFQRYSEAPHAFSGSTHEFNVTIRITILKHDPIIMVDSWLRILNASSPVAKIAVNPIMYDPGSGGAEGKDSERSLGYRYGIGYALGVVGFPAGAPSTPPGGNGYYTFSKYQMNESVINSDPLHARMMMLLADDPDGVKLLADRIGSVWATYQAIDALNLVVAKNANRYDAISYFKSSGYTVYPSEISETIYVAGTILTPDLQESPLAAYYEKVPLVTWVDDHVDAFGDNPTNDWGITTANRYGIPMTMPSIFDGSIHPYEYYDWINLTGEVNGTRYEIAEHGYDHATYYGNNYAWQLAHSGASVAQWGSYTSTPISSIAFPGNAWNAYSMSAMADLGIKNMRLSQVTGEYQMPRDFDPTGDNEFALAYMGAFVSPMAGAGVPGTITTAYSFGVLTFQGHLTDYDTVPEQALNVAWWSWVQNQTALLPVTFSGYSDLWHHRLEYSTADGQGIFDLSTCQVNHEVKLAAIDGGLPLIWDMTTNTAADIASYDFSRLNMTVIMRAGHIYREVGTILPDGDLTVRTQVYDQSLGASHVYQVYLSGAYGETDLTFLGLDDSQAYTLKLNGVPVSGYKTPGPDGSISYDNLTISPGQILTLDYTLGMGSIFAVMMPVLMAVVCISLIAGFLKKKK